MDLQSLNDRQREAVTAPDGPLLVVAGAGSGKTRVLTTRISWLMAEHGVRPSEILAFTFTNKAAREMRSRVESDAGEGAPWWIGTFHATGVKILRRDGAAIGIDPSFSIYDTDDSTRLIKKVLREENLDPKHYPPRKLRSIFSGWKNRELDPARVAEAEGDSGDENLVRAFKAYESALRASNALDFDDLILLTVRLLETCEDVRGKYASRFRHVLVDEFQDTNELQLVLIKALCSGYGNVFAVGDDDQSIYSWRGARVENMLQFEDYFPGARTIRLEQNYRSTGNILAAANAVIGHNRKRRGKNLWTAGDAGALIESALQGDEEDEASRLVEIVRAHSHGGGRRGDVTALYRTNAQSRVLEDALRRASIPYQVVGSTAFYERKEIRDVLAYLKLVNNPSDVIAANRIINVPKRKIGQASLEKLNAIALREALSLGEVAACGGLMERELSAAACKRIRDFFALVDRWRGAAPGLSVPELLTRILEEIAYDSHLQADEPESASGRSENVLELLNAAHAFDEGTDGGDLAMFLEQTALVADADTIRDDEGLVRLMTIHAAKGLEFPVVAICGVEESLMPHISYHDDPAGLEEERRLFYVALTRAERKVHLLHARMRRKFGQREYCEPSRFLGEIPAALVEETGETVVRSRASIMDFLGAERKTAKAARSGFSVSDWQRDVDQRAEGFYAGQEVLHPVHGHGVVVRLEGSGEDLKLSVDFPGGERKHFLAKFAKLKPL